MQPLTASVCIFHDHFGCKLILLERDIEKYLHVFEFDERSYANPSPLDLFGYQVTMSFNWFSLACCSPF